MTLAERIEKRGEERGRLEGKLERNYEIAKLMLADKLPLDYIIKFTNLTLGQIKALGHQDGNSGPA